MSQSREQTSHRLRHIHEQINENLTRLREAIIPLSPSSYVPLGALNSPDSVLRKIPVNVKPNPEKVEKYLFDRVLRL